MRRDGNARKGPLFLGILLGLLALAAGALAAGALLPEWRADEPLDEEVYRERYTALAGRAGFRLEPGEPRVRLATRGFKSWMLTDRTGIRIEVFHKVRGPGDGESGTFTVDFSADGRPQALAWWGASGFSMLRIPSIEESFRLMESLAPLLLHPGESLGEIRRGRYQTIPRLLVPIEGGARPQHLFALGFGNAQMGRRAGSLTKETVRAADASMARAISLFWLSILGTVLALGLFLALLLKARLSAANGALLALVSLATLRPVPDLLLGTRGSALWATGQVALGVFLLWSSAESLLRSTGPDFTTSLDALRAGRLGPREGVRCCSVSLSERVSRGSAWDCTLWPKPCRGSGRGSRASPCPCSGRSAARSRTASSWRRSWHWRSPSPCGSCRRAGPPGRRLSPWGFSSRLSRSTPSRRRRWRERFSRASSCTSASGTA